jgi:Na+/pantothenate symporter
LLLAVVGLTWLKPCHLSVVLARFALEGLECGFLACFMFGGFEEEFDDYGLGIGKHGRRRKYC